MSTKSPAVNMPLTVALATMGIAAGPNAVHCLRCNAVKTGSCRKITVDFTLVVAGAV
jgi:hypothetical protein